MTASLKTFDSGTIFLDMDGVLADLVRGVLGFYGRSDLRVADVTSWDLAEFLKIDPFHFWRQLGFKFWENLSQTDECRELIDRVIGVYGIDRVCILTSACRTWGCLEGKRDWARRNAGLPVFMVEGSRHKALLARSGVLVDDSDTNCEDWDNAGGRSVLVPRPWNSRRESCEEGGTFRPKDVVDELLTMMKV